VNVLIHVTGGSCYAAQQDGCHCPLPWEDSGHTFCDVKSFIVSQCNAPVILNKFFENELTEARLWHAHPITLMFRTNIQEIEITN
jgi:hypothetical protein